MKRKELMKRLASIAKEEGAELEVTEGGNHSIVRVGDRRTTVPRHRDINEITAMNILKQIGGNR